MAATESDLLPQLGHVNDDELPWIDAGDGIEMKLMRVVPEQGIWIIRNRFRRRRPQVAVGQRLGQVRNATD